MELLIFILHLILKQETYLWHINDTLCIKSKEKTQIPTLIMQK